MIDPYPNVDEFGPGAPTCDGRAVGCAPATLADLLIRYGKSVPRLPSGEVDIIAIGASAGRRHRAEDSRVTHGICPRAWCAYCLYLEAKARALPVAYGSLTWAQVLAHLDRGHAMTVPGDYQKVPYVAPSSYSATTPARGRSQALSARFPHMTAFWGRAGGNIIVSDPDFGSGARPVIPPHSLWTEAAARAYYEAFGWGIAYMLAAPAAIVSVPPPPAGVTYRFGGGPFWRGTFEVRVDAAWQRRSPFIRTDNRIRQVVRGTRFLVRQSTYSGSNVGGSTLWHGDATGTIWMHHSVIRPVS